MNTISREKLLIDLILPGVETKDINTVKDIILVSSFTFLIALCAKIKIEIGAVPITAQTFAVLLSGALLGSKRGAFSQILYLLLGLAGFPWFARGGGMQYILSPTFGYIIGFVIAAFFVGKLAENGWDKSFKTAIFSMIIGNIVIYIFGLMWLFKFIPSEDLLKTGLYPFLIGDLVKILLAGSILPFSWRLIKRFKRSKIF